MTKRKFVRVDRTFFPSHWTEEVLMNKIDEACRNAIKIAKKFDGTTEIIGTVSEGFKVLVKLDRDEEPILFFPILKLENKQNENS